MIHDGNKSANYFLIRVKQGKWYFVIDWSMKTLAFMNNLFTNIFILENIKKSRFQTMLLVLFRKGIKHQT